MGVGGGGELILESQSALRVCHSSGSQQSRSAEPRKQRCSSKVRGIDIGEKSSISSMETECDIYRSRAHPYSSLGPIMLEDFL